MSQEDVTIAKIATDIEYIKRDVAAINARIGKDYVSRTEFEPVKQVVYGVVAVILLSVAGAIIALVIKT